MSDCSNGMLWHCLLLRLTFSVLGTSGSTKSYESGQLAWAQEPGNGVRIWTYGSKLGLKVSVVIEEDRAARAINSLVPDAQTFLRAVELCLRQPLQPETCNAWWIPSSAVLCRAGLIYQDPARKPGLCLWLQTCLCPKGGTAKLYSFKFSLIVPDG